MINTDGFTKMELLISLALIGIIGLVAVPSWIRAQISANEAEAVGDTRDVISAEQTFASANCGYFDDLPNLCRDGEDWRPLGVPGSTLRQEDPLPHGTERRRRNVLARESLRAPAASSLAKVALLVGGGDVSRGNVGGERLPDEIIRSPCTAFRSAFPSPRPPSEPSQ